MTPFTLHIPKDVEGQLSKCRASIRLAIRQRLQDILGAVIVKPKRRGSSAPGTGPAQRFYVFEGYRVSYQVNSLTRRVVVLALQPESG